MKLAFTIFTLTLSLTSFACSDDGKSGFLPENDMYIPAGLKNQDGGITQAQFNAVIDKVEGIYAREVSSMGGKLEIERSWTDGNVNAYASRDGSSWIVKMFGGLARHPEITPDGFALVLCHELGHHIGGAPKKVRHANPWSSSEGQSDYFATLKCLRQVFLNDNNAKIVRSMKIPGDLISACAKTYRGPEREICVRSGMAGASVAGLFASLEKGRRPQFTSPSRSVVAVNVDSHPDSQCRLDTFFQGALCAKSMNEDVSQTDEVKATCHKSLGDLKGLRPSCWFKSKR